MASASRRLWPSLQARQPQKSLNHLLPAWQILADGYVYIEAYIPTYSSRDPESPKDLSRTPKSSIDRCSSQIRTWLHPTPCRNTAYASWIRRRIRMSTVGSTFSALELACELLWVTKGDLQRTRKASCRRFLDAAISALWVLD